jgi:hypothetical protein
MSTKSRLTIEEAVARFFLSALVMIAHAPDAFIKWLESCGYDVVPVDETSLVPEPPNSDHQSTSAKLLAR